LCFQSLGQNLEVRFSAAHHRLISHDDRPFPEERMRRAMEDRLEALIPTPDHPPASLHRAMRHTLFAPAKRIRAVLAMMIAQHFMGDERAALDSACALEMVQAASLILDDLPSMDDATLRRGLPTNHLIFGEATALLAAIALLNRAFGVIAEDKTLSFGQRVAISERLSCAIGSDGLVAGQEQDLKWTPDGASKIGVMQVHARKTAALFAVAAEIGALSSGACERDAAWARELGHTLGAAFQIGDDLLDATASSDRTGKNIAQDRGRPSLVLTIGAEAAREEIDRMIARATELLVESRSDKSALGQFVISLVDRFGIKLTLNVARK
jgi:geranylgeranyl diphosphate synthase type II